MTCLVCGGSGVRCCEFGADRELQPKGEVMQATEVQMPVSIAKKNVIRFDTSNPDAPVSNVYVDKAWVQENGGCPKGVKVTLEPIQ